MLSIALTILLIFGYGAILQTEAQLQVALLWIHGSFTATVFGHLWTVTGLRLIRNHVYSKTLKRKEKIDNIYVDSLAVSGWQVGMIERVFFGALVTFDISATAAGMVTWILVKMATDWNRILGQCQNEDSMYGARSLAFGSLLAGMISLFFALIGGIICRRAVVL
jgi:hypothetical protein